jgi:hypothetical protein
VQSCFDCSAQFFAAVMESRCSSRSNGHSNGQSDAPCPSQSSGYTQLQQLEDDTPPTVFKHYSESVCKAVKGAHSSVYSSVLQQQQQQHHADYQPDQQSQQQQQQCDYDSYSYDAAATGYDCTAAADADDFYADCEEVQPVEHETSTTIMHAATTASAHTDSNSASTRSSSSGAVVNREVISLDDSSDAEDETAVDVTAAVTAPTATAVTAAAADAAGYESNDSFLYEVMMLLYATLDYFHYMYIIIDC